MSQFDIIVIGAGPGGYVTAIKAAQLGMKTAIVEKSHLGGTCLNCGCIPTKALLNSANIYHLAKNGADFGLHIDGLGYDMAAMHQYKDDVVAKLRDGIAALLGGNKIELISGEAKIMAPHRVQVGENTYSAENIVIVTGSQPLIPPIPGIDLPGVVSSEQMLAQAYDCHRLAIIGAGVIGMEFASLYNRLGAEVTVLEMFDRVLPTIDDKEISQNLTMLLKKRAVNIHTSAQVTSIEKTVTGLVCHFTSKDEEQIVEVDNILVATGRKGCIEGLVADGLDLNINHKSGQIVINKDHRSSVDSIYAIGDVAEHSMQLAHMASAEGINLAYHLAGQDGPINLDIVPGCIFSDPEIATVGLTEAKAKEQGIAVKVGKYLMSGNSKSMLAQAERGFIKIIAEQESKRILGAQLMCSHAADLVNELSLAIAQGLSAADIAAVIHPHPTFGEGIAEAAEAVFDTSIHSLPKRR